MAHFNFFATGAPVPSTCMKCGDYRDLYDLGIDVWEGAALICVKCIKDLAALVNYVDGAVAQEQADRLNAQLAVSRETIERIPNEVEKLIDGVRNSVADFVLTVSGSSDDSSSIPVQEPSEGAGAVSEDKPAAANNRKAPSKSASH